MRRAFQVKRAAARAAKSVTQKALAIKLVLALYDIMLSHPEGWTLMLGMPSAQVLSEIRALRDNGIRCLGCGAKIPKGGRHDLMGHHYGPQQIFSPSGRDAGRGDA